MTDLTALVSDLSAWIGRSQTTLDEMTSAPLLGLNATLDHPPLHAPPGTPVPPLWHWLYFLPRHPQSDLGEDGHARRGDFLPPVPLPRRMWAASRFEFHGPLCVGEEVERRSTVTDVRVKQGRSGPLVFVTVRHDHALVGAHAPALVEFHDIVYREAAQPGEPQPIPQAAPTGALWQRCIVPDDVLLFRYSALTFNGHRIHYDRRYTTQVEGYPGLVVHGPLIATYMIDLLRVHAPERTVAEFQFRAVRPTFDLHPFSVHAAPQADGRSVKLWAQDHEGWLTMEGQALLA